MGSAGLLAPLPPQVGVEPGGAALARRLLSLVALPLAPPAQAQSDTTAPTLVSATANTNTLRLDYNEALDTNSTPAATAFTVKVDGSGVSLSSTNSVAVSGMAVTLTLANGVYIGKTVTVSYTPGSNPIQDSAGNDAVALMDQSVTVSGICDRTSAVQTAILAKIPGIAACGDVTSTHLSGITGLLNLAAKGLTSLQEDDFDGLSSLEQLYLNNNSLRSLDNDIFDGLSSLDQLILFGNSLSSLDGDIFDGLSLLKTLWLNNNSLRSLDNDIFDGLSSLDQLILFGNSLSSLDGDIFDGLSLLKTLWLNNNSLRSLDNDIFDGLSSLDQLILFGNSLSSLDGDIFDGLSLLKTLWLNNNSLRSLDNDIFDGLSSLDQLILFGNSLSSLDGDIFDGLSLLKTLWLNNNSLRSLDNDIFDGLSSLDQLILFGNSLSSLDGDIFDGLSNLEELQLNNNSLSSLPEGLFSSSRLPGLTTLLLSNNGLFCLPRDLARRSSIIQGTAVRDLPDCYGVSLSVSPTEVSEGSGGESITVSAALKDGNRVKTEATTVTISVDSGTATEGTDFTMVSDFTITIASGSSSNSGTFTLTARKDAVADDSETVKVTGSTGLSDSSVAGTEVEEAEVSIRNTPPGVEVSPTSLTVEEGESGIYTVVLDTRPSGNVTVTPGSGDSGVAMLTPASLTFTTTSWNTPQTVTVSSVEEDDIASEDQTITISHGVSGYGSVSSANVVTVTVTDDDIPGVSVEPTSLTVNEGGSGVYTVVLDTLPSGNVTVTPGSGDSGVAMLTPASLTFTITSWNTPQTVTVSSVEEDDIASEDQTITISHGVSGYGSVSSANVVTVTVTDDDTAGVRVNPTTLTMREGESGSYTMVLESQPTGAVTITPRSEHADVTFSPTSLTFSSSDWNTARTMTVTAGQDEDSDDETVTIGHSVSGYGSVSSAAAVTVTVRDDDEATGKEVLKGWLPRFGRTVAQQVVEQVSRRFQQSSQPGLEVSVAGEQLTNRGPWEEEQAIMAKLLGFETVSEGQLVKGTEFAFSPSQQHDEQHDEGNGEGEGEGDGNGEGLAFWGGGELGSFNGQQDAISLSGDVTTALVGAHWQRQRWQAGAALSHSWGRGSYEEGSSGGEGEINSTLTGLFPYGRYALNDHLNFWGVVGHGWGHLSLFPEGGEQQSTSIEMTMGAMGLDGLLLDGGGSGLTIRSTADALLLGVNSEETEDLEGIQGEVSRLRLGLEAERPFPLSPGGAFLTPSLELALRQDGGDAETGFGLDLAAALIWSDPLRGMEVELRGHTLLSHGDAAFHEQGLAASMLWSDPLPGVEVELGGHTLRNHGDQAFHEKGLAASLSWDPDPSSPLGPSLSLSQSMGASASSGGNNDALLTATAWPELETSTSSSAGEDHQFAATMGYGFLTYRDALLITPKLGVALSGDGATTTLGFSLAPYSQQGDGHPWEVVLERRHSNGSSDDPTTQHSLDLRFSLLF